MSGVLKIERSETVETLQELLTQQKKAKMQQRVQVLYWVKTKQAATVEHLATLVGQHRTTVSRWLSEYRVGGLAQLLNIQTSPGRTRKIPPSVETKLREELKDPQGFSSYKEIQVWLKLFDNLDELRDSLKKVLDKLTVQDITSLTKWQFLVEGLSVANI